MFKTRREWSIAVGLVGFLASARHASGQSAGYQLDRYEPTPAGDTFSVVEAPWYSTTRWFAAALSFDYAHNLLVADPDGSAPAPIAHHQAGHLDLAGSFHERFGFSLSVPLVLAQSGTAFAGVGPSGTTAGDPRAGLRVRLFGDDARLSASAAAYLWIPIGAEDDLAGDASVRGMGRFTLAGLASSQIRWALNTSVLLRKRAVLSATVPAAGNSVGSEVQLGGAAAYTGLTPRLSLGPEALLSVAASDQLPSEQSRVTLEAYGTARFAFTDSYSLGLGVGGGITGSGVPDARVLFSLTYAPVRERLGSSFESVVVLPDEEDGHIGGVEVNDGKTTTLLDKPYASTELRKSDKRVRPVQGTKTSVAKSTSSLAKALPPSDRDRDGIVDAQDACPDRAGLASDDPIRRGCPTAVEKVVVLPDADGHIGGVEVDDGETKVLLDTPYATSEVSAAGKVSVATASPPKAVERTIASVAGSLPPPDADGDGVLDPDDACPDRAGIESSNPIRRGCPAAAERIVVMPDPDGHIGGVEVDDGHSKTLIDTAWAAVEVSADGVAQAVPPTRGKSAERAIAALASTLPIADGDKDNIRDEQDACPERAGIASPDPLRNGCPASTEKVVVFPDADGHIGGVEIDDGKTKVLLDTAYATAEVSGGKVAVVAASPPGAIVRATATVAHALPLQDRDDDNIVDSDDACPTRAGRPSQLPNRHGCPTTVESVVVLPDENGHVGAVDVDDGKSKVMLDQAYASAEIGADGVARSMAAEASEVSTKFAAAMAARPPGARIILYFTARAEPVRDLTGPIDNLAAEAKARTDVYTIEVIGHTDQTGSEKKNLKIGLERAQLIADRLIAAGVPKDRVKVTSMGSKEPAIKLKSRRVVELRNRRVEIWVR